MKRSILLILIVSPLYLIANPFEKVNGVQSLREQKKSMATPDIPGNLVVDLGFNLLLDKAPEMDKKFWGSKSVGLTYMIDYSPANTFFSLNVGLGLGLEKYALEDDLLLSTTTDDELGRVATIDTLDFNANKSKIVMNYVEIPFEFRIYTNQTDREKGMFFALGASAGYLYQSFTKLKYELDGVNNKVKNNTEFELNKFRARAIIRGGFRGFNFFYKLGLTELFNSNRGPSGAPAKMYTIGISFVGF